MNTEKSVDIKEHDPWTDFEGLARTVRFTMDNDKIIAPWLDKHAGRIGQSEPLDAFWIGVQMALHVLASKGELDDKYHKKP